MGIKLSAYGKLAYLLEADVYKTGKIVWKLTYSVIGEPQMNCWAQPQPVILDILYTGDYGAKSECCDVVP